MAGIFREAGKLTPEELREYPVWEYQLNCEPESGELVMAPVTDLPVYSLANRIVGTEVRFTKGVAAWALLANVCLKNVRGNKHFLSVSVLRQGNQWVHLDRYHDVTYTRETPERFAGMFNLAIEEVFPISYDISKIAVGLPDVVRGKIAAYPDERVSEDELIQMALEIE